MCHGKLPVSIRLTSLHQYANVARAGGPSYVAPIPLCYALDNLRFIWYTELCEYINDQWYGRQDPQLFGVEPAHLEIVFCKHQEGYGKGLVLTRTEIRGSRVSPGPVTYGIKGILQVFYFMDLVSSKHNNQVHNTIESINFKRFEAPEFLGLLRFLTN